MDKAHARTNAILAGLVFAIAFLTYMWALAPTVSFWDCGEYAAAGSTLQIPHPPGNPLWIMMCRVFTVGLSFIKDAAYRMNIMVPLTGAFSAMLIYLVIVRAFIGGIGQLDTIQKKLSVYIGGLVGALFAAFSKTVLFCAVENEVNLPLVLPIALGTWLSLVWAQSKDSRRDKYLLLITYIAFLGIGIHMYSMITLITTFLFVMIVDKEKRLDWRLWITAAVLGIVVYSLSLFIIVGSIAVVATLLFSLISGPNQRKWQFCFLLSLMSVLGFSSHLYIPIRSALNPQIDEGHPANWKAFDEYLDRKQYGSDNMITRMMWRRGTVEHQFGVEGNMGFGGFFITQFFHFSKLDTQNDQTGKPYIFTLDGPAAGAGKMLLYLIPLAFALYGMSYLYKKNRNAAVMLIVLFILTTIAMTLYMNFSDGTKCELRDYEQWVKYGKQGAEPLVHREVRVRDYFWIVGFVAYGMWIGIAAGAALLALFANKNKFLRGTLAPIAAILCAVSPALPFYSNVSEQSRRGMFVPFDYAFNLLMSCEKDGILFTNGDNDTFPLWALQEAFGIRKDVRIVNLSLVNTDWYIKQMKDFEPKVPISYTHSQIQELNHQLNPFTQPTPYPMRNAGITVTIPDQKTHNALRVQDKMVLNIVDANAWKKPIYFAVTVSDDNFMGLEPYLQMQGLAYRVYPTVIPQDQKMDIDRTIYLLDKVYRFRGLGDGTSNLDETTEKLMSNYAACYIQVALQLRQQSMSLKDRATALDTVKNRAASQDSVKNVLIAQSKSKIDIGIEKLDQCIAIMPWEWRWRGLRHEFLMNAGYTKEAEERARQALAVEPSNPEYQKMLAQALMKNGKESEANRLWKEMIAKDPNPWDAYYMLAQNYAEKGLYDSAIAAIAQFGDMHPGDRRVSSIIGQYQLMKSQSSQKADTSKK